MCDENTDKGHKTCLVKTKSVYVPVGEQSFRNPLDPTDEKFYSNEFYDLTDFDPVIVEENGKKVRRGRSNDKSIAETYSDTGSIGSRSMRWNVRFGKRSDFPIPFDKNHYKNKFEPNIFNEESMLPKMQPNSKNVLMGIEVCLYPSGHEDVNRVAKITGMYFTDIWNIYDKSKFNAHVDEKVSDNPEYNLHMWIPSIYQSDLLFSNKVLGDQKVEKTKAPAERMELEIQGKNVTQSVYGNRQLIMAPNGQAVTGVRFYNTSSGDRAIEGIELEFSNFYDRNKTEKTYKHILNGVVSNGQFQSGLNNSKIYKLQCNDNEYIQQLWFSYANEAESTTIDMLKQVIQGVSALFSGDAVIKGQTPHQFGVKAIIGANKLVVENLSDMQKWIESINDVRTCDMTGDTLYDDDTIEYIYAKFIKEQFLYLDGTPSNKCKTILSNYCNMTSNGEVLDESLYEDGMSDIVGKVNEDIIMSSDELNLKSPNGDYSLTIGSCEICPTNKLTNTLNIIWKEKINHWISNENYLKDKYNYSCEYQEDCSSSIMLTKGGDLILYSDLSGFNQSRLIWKASNTSNFSQGAGAPYTLRMHNTGNLIILDKNANITWSSGTKDMKEFMEFSDNIDKKLCFQACRLNDINCDKGITTYCSKKTYTVEIPLYFEEDYTDFDRKKKEWTPKSFTETIREFNRKIRVPMIADVYTDKICPCTLPESDEIMRTIKEYYEKLLPLYQKESATLENNSSPKQYIEQDIIKIKNRINEVNLYNALASYDDSLKLRLLPEKYLEMTRQSGGKLRQQCSFPWCAKSNYKLFSMKQDIQRNPCNETEGCMGGGFAIFSTEDPGYKVMCNMQLGLKNKGCVMNDRQIGSTKYKLMDPNVALIPYPKNFLNCKQIFDKSYTPKTEWVPSFCELGDVDVEDESSYECLPDPSNNNIKSFFAKRPVYTPEIPLGMEGLCPAPWDLDALYVNTGKECEPFDCSINLQSLSRGVCDEDGYQTIEYRVIPNNSLGKTCNEVAEKIINPSLSTLEKSEGIFWSELTKDDEKNYISATVKCRGASPTPSPTCPTGQRFENGRCVNIVTPPGPTPSTTCPIGQRFENGRCVNICPIGQRFENNRCVNIVTPPGPTPSTTCPAGQRLENNSCVNICPIGQRFENNRCVNICPAGQRFENNRCVNEQNMDEQSYKEDKENVTSQEKSKQQKTKTMLLVLFILMFILIIFFFFFFFY